MHDDPVIPGDRTPVPRGAAEGARQRLAGPAEPRRDGARPQLGDLLGRRDAVLGGRGPDVRPDDGRGQHHRGLHAGPARHHRPAQPGQRDAAVRAGGRARRPCARGGLLRHRHRRGRRDRHGVRARRGLVGAGTAGRGRGGRAGGLLRARDAVLDRVQHAGLPADRDQARHGRAVREPGLRPAQDRAAGRGRAVGLLRRDRGLVGAGHRGHRRRDHDLPVPRAAAAPAEGRSGRRRRSRCARCAGSSRPTGSAACASPS